MTVVSWAAFREALKESPRARKMVRWWRARSDGYPRWDALVGGGGPGWAGRVERARGGSRVLVATSVGAYLPGANLESLIAAALTVRGAEVHALLCDGALSACSDCLVSWYPDVRRFAERGPQADLCGTCFRPAAKAFRRLGLPLHSYGELIAPDERAAAVRLAWTVPAADIPGHRLDGLAIGEHALAGALRFYARGNLRGEPHGEAVLRRYFEASLLTAHALRALLARERFDVVVVHHGIYVPMGIIGEVCRAAGVRIVNWNPAYRKRSFIFSHGDTYHHTLVDEPTGVWESMEWGRDQEQALLDYLKSRWQGSQDWIFFHDRPEEDLRAIARELGVDFAKPCIGLLTNVVWDAQLHYPANAFPGMLEWLIETIEYFRSRPDLQLVVRVHPAEIRGAIPSRQLAVDEIRRAVPDLPANVVVIPPESRVSTYAAMLQCNAVIIYGTKTGVELTSVGKPVVVAGEAWIRNKGLTRDAATREEYFRILDGLPLAEATLDAATVQRARRYAYHFFFRRMIPVTSIAPTGGWPPFHVSAVGADALEPGHDLGLDVICEGILRGTPFIYPAERLEGGRGG